MVSSKRANEELQRELRRRKNEANLLAETTAQLSHLLLYNPAIIYSRQPEGNYPTTFVSENVQEKLGYEPWEFLDEPRFWIDHIHPEDRAKVCSGLSFLLANGYYICDYHFQDKNGSYHLIHDELKLISDTDGEPVEIVGCMLDISRNGGIWNG